MHPISIAENLETIRNHITQTAKKCGRNPDEIDMVAVSKRFPTEAIKEAFIAGQRIFGENYIQEIQEKHDDLPPETNIHFIGHLQSNKAKIAAQLCDMIETVDRIKLAKELNKYLLQINKTLDILVQVNIGLDKNKSGITADETEKLLLGIAELQMLRPKGLMTIPPVTVNPEDARPFFRNLRKLGDILKGKKLFFDNNSIELSMGMSNDYEIAIEEGATLVRIGTAIFGRRPDYGNR